jgi:hypothetical protein
MNGCAECTYTIIRSKLKKIERFTTITEHLKTDLERATNSLLNIIRLLQLDDALDYFAVLAVEWARRGYVQEGFHPKKIGYSFPEDASTTDIDEWITKNELWGFAEAFHIWL